MTLPLEEFYERALIFLEEVAPEFAARFPAQAGRIRPEPGANVDPHLELLTHHRLDRRLHLPCQFSLVDHLAAFLSEQQLGQAWRARQTPDVRREHSCVTCMHNAPHYCGLRAGRADCCTRLTNSCNSPMFRLETTQ